ncbi:CbtA family protein [Calidifontibacter terrae]
MERALILRGALSGALAGLLAFAFARIFAEPQITAAINYEEGRHAAQHLLDKAAGVPTAAHEHDVFSRTLQANLGIGVGMIAFGLAMGVIFAVTYTICLGRFGGVRARGLSLLVAAAGFVALYLVPFMKYPANPPAIGHADTIRTRSNLYLLMVLVAALLMVGAVLLGHWLRRRLGPWSSVVVGGLAYAVTVGVVMAILPSYGELAANVAHYGHHATETPLPLRDSSGTIVYPGFPADVLASFRLNSVVAQGILWGAIGLLFAPMAERALAGAGTTRTLSTPARDGVSPA